MLWHSFGATNIMVATTSISYKCLKLLLRWLPDICDCIHFVGDRYDASPAESLKGEEREKRMKTCPNTMKEYKPHDTLAFKIH